MTTTIIVILAIALLGIVVWWNYYIKITNDAAKGRLPKQGRVETDPTAWVDQNGKPRKLEDLTGKVVVWSYVYTTCPMGCLGIAEEMAKLQQEFGSNPKFQLVSISLYPEHDRPDMLKGWTDSAKFGGENWWFLTSAGGQEKDGNAVRRWMEKTFGIWARKKDAAQIAKNPADVWDHPLVMVMSDHKENVITPTFNDRFWHPYHQAFQGWYPRNIREDIKKLLEEADQK